MAVARARNKCATRQPRVAHFCAHRFNVERFAGEFPHGTAFDLDMEGPPTTHFLRRFSCNYEPFQTEFKVAFS